MRHAGSSTGPEIYEYGCRSRHRGCGLGTGSGTSGYLARMCSMLRDLLGRFSGDDLSTQAVDGKHTERR